jgi:protein phosphatase
MSSTYVSHCGLESSVDLLTPTDRGGARVAFSFGAKTHPGKVRENNEDHFLVTRLAKSMHVCRSSLPDDGADHFSEDEGYLLIVADGMGGAAAGECASALAVASVEAHVLNRFRWFVHQGRQEQNLLFDELRVCFEDADRELIERARANPRLAGMGTTLTLAYSVGSDLFVAHAGDSRAYVFRGGTLERVTRDHTYVQMLVNIGEISPEAARRDARRNIVTNIIGGPREGVRAELHRFRLMDGDVVLLCSDGLSDPVGDEAIAEVLGQTPDPSEASDRLVELALRRGGPDNVTAIVARYEMPRGFRGDVPYFAGRRA